MPPVEWTKSPGWDWIVTYQFDDGGIEEMSVFGQRTMEDAVREARFSLDGINNMNVGKYAILGVMRVG